MEPGVFRELYTTAGEAERDPEERKWAKPSGYTHGRTLAKGPIAEAVV